MLLVNKCNAIYISECMHILLKSMNLWRLFEDCLLHEILFCFSWHGLVLFLRGHFLLASFPLFVRQNYILQSTSVGFRFNINSSECNFLVIYLSILHLFLLRSLKERNIYIYIS